MKITKLVASEKGKNNVLIFVDNQYFTTLDAEVVLKLRLKPELELDIEILDQMKEEQDFKECYSKALGIVSKMQKTKKQLKDYLFNKGYEYRLINVCVEKLERLNFINDDLYCKKYIEQEKDKKGKMMIYRSLMLKGIDKEIIENNLKDFSSQKETISNLVKKYMKNKTKDFNTIQKLKRYLLGKGFSYEEINSVLGEYDESWD